MSEGKYKLYLPKNEKEYFDNWNNYEFNSFVVYNEDDKKSLEVKLSIDKKNWNYNLISENVSVLPIGWILDDSKHDSCYSRDHDYTLMKDHKLNRKLYKVLAENKGYIVVKK